MSPLRIFLGALVSLTTLNAFRAAPARAERFLSYPSDGVRTITCDFCCYINRYGRCHHAIDYGIPTSGEIRAAAAGTVTLADDGHVPGVDIDKYEYGNQVRIRHPNSYLTIYAHLLPNTITVRVGDRVETGQRLGLSDNTGKSTGPHLHFEVRDPQGRRVNPYGDPPDYRGGCGPNALWVTCPPTPAPPPDSDGDGYTTAQDDCDDANRDVYPGATEHCNGRDDDCNRTIDDPWVRSGLAQRIGASCAVGRGQCARNGQWTCAPDGRATVCNATPGIPSTESCNSIDDDCDGQTDEDWRSGSTALGRPCTITWSTETCIGTATTGAWICTPDGLTVVCSAPNPEVCDGNDNDCNGAIDDVPAGDLASDNANCGACGNACVRWGTYCASGTCTYSCNRNICAEYCRAIWCTDCGPQATCISMDACLTECQSRSFSECQRYCLCTSGCSAYRVCQCP